MSMEALSNCSISIPAVSGDDGEELGEAVEPARCKQSCWASCYTRTSTHAHAHPRWGSVCVCVCALLSCHWSKCLQAEAQGSREGSPAGEEQVNQA